MASTTISRASVNRMGIVDAPTDRVTFDDLDTHDDSGGNGLFAIVGSMGAELGCAGSDCA